MSNTRSFHAPCPYFDRPLREMCGSDLCRIIVHSTGPGGTVVTCGGVKIPDLQQFEAITQDGDRYDVWLRGGSSA